MECDSTNLTRRIVRGAVALGKEKFQRYLVPECMGTVTAFGGAFITRYFTDSDIAIGYAAALSENVGFYGSVLAREIYRGRNDAQARHETYTLKNTLESLAKIGAEFGPAELLDTPLIRPAATALGNHFLGTGFGVLVGKLAADLAFYVNASAMHEAVKRYWPEKASEKK